ncbi:CDP-glucose 4,6-dehydratase [Chengkuizengella sp. SCS-71B]|uniref:CDP-glucose 4,6-dehydratase n=1 Tax=Chengkuizengella sp. SCS-71B TaxID=3115290 RepID=UPI0032C238E2
MLNFYKNKSIFVTGHTGFKGAWLCKILINAGSRVTGYALDPPTNPSLFKLSGLESQMTSIIKDIRDAESLQESFNIAQPEIVIHLASQPLVLASYENPHYTYETNVMGTVNILECIRKSNNVKSVLIVTSDKVYKNNKWIWGYRENDPLGGDDPYSNSKSCSELITKSYKKSFLKDKNIAISTARAGNVLGGGDFAKHRIIPDCIRAIENNVDIIVRNPYSRRHYQHVFEPLYAYLMIIQKQYDDMKYSDCYNVGPDERNCITNEELVDLFCEKWEIATGDKQNWVYKLSNDPPEASLLKLDSSKFHSIFKWQSEWNIEKAIEKTIEWTKVYMNNEDIDFILNKQIEEFLKT